MDPTDTVTPSGEEELVSAPNPRDVMLEEAAQRRNAQINSELEEGGSDERIDIPESIVENEDEIAAEPPADEIVAEEVDPPEEVIPPAEDEPAPIKSGPMASVTMEDGTVIQVPAASVRTTAKVDGEDSEVVLDQMVRSHQTVSAADRRMSEAAARIKAAEDREAALGAKEQVQPPSGDVASTAPPSGDVRTQAEVIVETLYSGDTEKATTAIMDLLQPRETPSAPVQSADDIAAVVEDKLDTRQAGRKFQKEFKDIASDRFLMARADAFAEEIALENPGMSKEDIFMTAGTRTQDWVKRQAGVEEVTEVTPEPTPKTTPAATTMENRKGRKARAAQNIPTSKQVAGLGEIEKPRSSNSDVIAEMRKSRGQA